MRIASYVEATRRHDAKTGDAALVVDLDLSVLGASESVFDAFEANVRAEYSHVGDLRFRLGRRRVLRGFLERPVIYRVPAIRDELEATARANIERRLGEL